MADTRISIIGCGAVGSIFAAHLARLPDVEVWAFDVNAEHIRAIQTSGLRLSGAADFTVQLQATADPNQIPRCDFGIVATKSVHTRAAMAVAAHAFDDRSAVCSVQNGVGNEEIIAEYVRYVIRGTTFPAGHVAAPGHVVYDIAGKTWIGPFEPSGTPMIKVSALADMLNHAGLSAVALPDARGAQWSKLVFNAATNPVGAVTGLHHGAATRFEPTGALFEALVDEGMAVAKALGITLHDDPKQMIRYAANAPGKHKASMLQDVEARRPTEVDFMNGAIVRMGEQAGVPTPLNRAIWALVKGLEHSWTNP
ncbi:MAG TPA: 2-dehydropantoate 2-reductase [Candidatus Acidoferrales bacterium]|nr:2-dehydropantoate 2-reductase [Candidatus Acidoferrales bacterium]